MKYIIVHIFLLCFSSWAESCDLFMFQSDRNKLKSVVTKELSSLDDLDENQNKLISALSYRYGIEREQDQQAANVLLNSIQLKESNLAMKIIVNYSLGSYYYSCGEKSKALDRLIISSQLGDHRSKFLSAYIMYNDNDLKKITIEEYLLLLTQASSNKNPYAIFEVIYMSYKKGELKHINGLAYYIEQSGALDNCDFYYFFVKGKGVNGLTVDANFKSDVIKHTWEDYFNMCN